MKLSISNLKELSTKGIRFSVTLSGSDGEPLWTSEGWRIFHGSLEVKPPAIKGWGGKLISYNTISPKFEEMIREAILKFEGVRESLERPVVEGMEEPHPSWEKKEEVNG